MYRFQFRDVHFIKTMISKNTRDLLIIVLIAVIFWTAFEVYHAHVNPNIESNYKSNIAPITSDLNVDTIEGLKQRIRVEKIKE